MPTRSRFASPPPTNLREAQRLAAARLNQGMVTTIDSTEIPNEALALAVNARCRYDKTLRRPGKISVAPLKPNSNKILGLVVFKQNNENSHFLRFTRNSIHRRGSTSWTAYSAGTSGSLTGTDDDRFSFATILNDFVFANGVDKLQKTNVGLLQYQEVGVNAPRVRFVTGFFNRAVGAYRVEANEPNGPVSLVWCADGDLSKWPGDPDPDISSGQTPLVESSSDLADFITGVFGGPNVMLVLRERSIWAATKQPIASNPFNLGTAVPGIGSDCPFSASVIPGGIAFLDTRTSAVWAYGLGSPPERISTAVESEMMKAVDDPEKVFSGFNLKELELTIGIPITGTNAVRQWTYGLRTKAWVFDEVEDISFVGDIDTTFSTALTFDDLMGTFDSLTGTFDQLVGASSIGKPARNYGTTTGEILEESLTAINDVTTPFEMELQSKDFSTPGVDLYVAEIRVEYQARQAGQLTLSYSKDNGTTWTVAKTITTEIGKPRLLRYVRHIVARRLRWKLEATNGELDILGYEILAYPSGESRR